MADAAPTPPQPESPPTTVATAPEPAPDPYADRFERIERLISALTGQVTSVQQNLPAPAAPQAQELKDDELWALAQQGNRQAFELYMERIARRTSGTRITEYQEQQSVQQQLAALYQKYPELGNPNHPLTQRAVQFRAALTQMGEPNSLRTDLNAILRAVADSREILSPRIAPSVQTPVSGQMGVQHRQATTPSTPLPTTPEETALASKMGLKRNPAEAKERFWKRNADGRNAVSPAIAVALERE